jgi:hypothetical protein
VLYGHIAVATPNGSGFAFEIDPERYRDHLNLYEASLQAFAVPGAQVTLLVKDAQRHDPLFESVLTLVTDDDPRLPLRYDRDTRDFRVKWGTYESERSNLYLKAYAMPDSSVLHADAPYSLFLRQVIYTSDSLPSAMVPRTTTEQLKALLTEEMAVFVNGRKLKNPQITLSCNNNTTLPYMQGNAPDTMIQTMEGQLKRTGVVFIEIKIEHPDYDFQPMRLAAAFVQ